MSHTLENAKDELQILSVIVLLIAPYSLLFYKQVGVRIRLLFISLIEILFLCILVGGASFGNENYMAYGCGYELFTVVSIPLNLIIISISWILSKTKDGNKKT
jgi:hypothetical protein